MNWKHALALCLSCVALAARAQDASPTIKLDGSLTTGLHCFVPLQDPSRNPEIYMFDNPLGGMNAPYQAIIGGRLIAPDYGLSVHVSSGYNSIPAGGSVQDSFQLWDAYLWAGFGKFTIVAGQLDESGFRSWIDCQSYLGRDRFGSAGLAVKYGAGEFNAILEVPAYIPNASSNQNTRYYAVYYDATSVGLDGSAWAALNAIYAAANYTVPEAVAFQVGYQGQGLNAGGYTNGANVWVDVRYLGVPRLICYLEWEGWNLGQTFNDGSPVGGLAFGAFALVGWSFDRFTLQSSVSFLEGDTNAAGYYNLRVQPSLRYPIDGTLTAVLTGRVDNILGTMLTSQYADKPSFWINPECQVSVHGNQIAFGLFVGNDYTGGDQAGGSWFFGNTAASTPGFDGGSYVVSSPRFFLDCYVSFVFNF